MYADDLILMSPSITILQKLLQIVEDNLISLEMSINPSKSSCIRFGPRYDIKCANIISQDGSSIPWVKHCKYLGITMLSSRVFKCVFDNSKKSYYKSFNAIFGKIGRLATADVVIHLLQTKCLPILMYGLNACPVNVSDSLSFDFVIYRTLAKIFETFSKDIINECRIVFGIPFMVDTIKKHKTTFLERYCVTENHLCRLFASSAKLEIKALTKSF